LVHRIGDIQVAVSIESQAGGKRQLGHGRGAAVAAKTGDSGARKGSDQTVGCDFANAVPGELGDVQVAGGIERQVARREHLRAGGRSAIAGRALAISARVGVDRAGGADAAHAVVAEVGDVEVAVWVDGEAVGKVELCRGGGAAVAAEAGGSHPGHGSDDAVRVDFADAVVAGVGEVEIAGTVGGDTLNGGYLGVDSGPAIAQGSASGDGGDDVDGAGGVGRGRRRGKGEKQP
jgi:hypothetical protein